MLLPPVVAAVIWRLIYNPNFGLLNASLTALGIDTSNWMWIAGQQSALLSVILVDVWEWTPFMFLLLLAGLQSLPLEPRLLQTFAYTGAALALEFGLGLALALLLNRQLAFRRRKSETGCWPFPAARATPSARLISSCGRPVPSR